MKRVFVPVVLLLLAVSAHSVGGNGSQRSAAVPVFPGAEDRPEVARAVEAYYRPGVPKTQTLWVGVYETPAAFQQVSDFYGSRTESGKWGFRRKTRALVQHTETIKFNRAQLLAQRGGGERLPEIFRPLFGDPGLRQPDFSKKLDRLLNVNKKAAIQVTEGTITMPGDPAKSQIRVTIERPYLDVNKMKLVDKTRIIMVKVS